MFNFIVKSSSWKQYRDTFDRSRMLEHTSHELKARLRQKGQFDFELLLRLPTLFVEETNGYDPQYARVGTLTRISESGNNLSLEYIYDSEIAPITNETLEFLSAQLDINDFEFTRTHWAVKDQDLFHVLLRQINPRRTQPNVFSLNDPEYIDPKLVSVMMPFSLQFDAVYDAIRNVSSEYGLRCERADDIWKNFAIIQDVVSLIDRSRIVICDCSDRNANVFYEAGIAHTLGRDVIFITQATYDIPFDIQHLRHASYLNNNEGLQDLQEKLRKRMTTLLGI